MLEKMWSNRNSHSSLVRMQNGVTVLEDSLAVTYKTKYRLIPYNPTVLLLGIYPSNFEIYVHAKPGTRMLTATLFVIAKNQKQPRCLLIGE